MDYAKINEAAMGYKDDIPYILFGFAERTGCL